MRENSDPKSKKWDIKIHTERPQKPNLKMYNDPDLQNEKTKTHTIRLRETNDKVNIFHAT